MFVMMVFFPETSPFTFGISNLVEEVSTTFICLYAFSKSCSYDVMMKEEKEGL